MFSRTALFLRLGLGGVLTLLVATVASAEPALQAATATPTPAPPSCVSPPSGVQVSLANPQPGDTLLSGVPVNITGVAYDPASTSASGVASVTVYLGARDAGGLSFGLALLGQPNPVAPAGSQFATAGFSLRTPNLPSGSGARSLFVYARSSITNIEAVLEVPIYLNASPTPVKGQVPTAVLPPPPTCTPTPAPTATPLPTVAVAPVAPLATPVILPTLAPLPTLALAPPAPAAPAAAPNPPPAAAAPNPPPAAAAPAAAQATTAPRGGGIPSEVGLALVSVGAIVLSGGLAMRRRQRRTAVEDQDSVSGT